MTHGPHLVLSPMKDKSEERDAQRSQVTLLKVTEPGGMVESGFKPLV